MRAVQGSAMPDGEFIDDRRLRLTYQLLTWLIRSETNRTDRQNFHVFMAARNMVADLDRERRLAG